MVLGKRSKSGAQRGLVKINQKQVASNKKKTDMGNQPNIQSEFYQGMEDKKLPEKNNFVTVDSQNSGAY